MTRAASATVVATPLLFLCLIGLHTASGASDPTWHPCQRECREDRKPMVCKYNWLVENYLVLSRACYNCPHNKTDCFRQHCVSADGFKRSIRTINRQLPGPPIRVCRGDTIEVLVANQMALAEGLTIHWHGILQRLSPHMDGVSMVTQCPIPSFSKFTYRFLADDAGTYLYHSHAGLYRGEGLFGGLVVRDAKSSDPQAALYDYDLPEHEVLVNDWPHTVISELYCKFFHAPNGNHLTEAPESILINGRGVYPSTRKKLNSMPLSEFNVQRGKRYRFRVSNTGALRCPIELSVDHHTLLLIASDGRPVQPHSVASIIIFSGERYDFVLDASEDGHSGLHWIRVRGMDKCELRKVQQFAILRYLDHHVSSSHGDNAPSYPDGPMDYEYSVPVDGERFNLWFLKPDAANEHTQINNLTALAPDDETLKTKADRQLFFEFAYRRRNNLHFHDPDLYPSGRKDYTSVTSVMINNISSILPPAPILTQLDDIDPHLICDQDTVINKDCSKEFCECVHVMEVQKGEVVELVVYDSNSQYGFTHPIHLHGHTYRVVTAERPTPKITHDRFIELDSKGLIKRRLHRAPLKDTLPVPNGGYLILRIKADNPGAWFMHCHVSLHAEIGMAITLHVRDPEQKTSIIPPDFPRCGSWPRTKHNATENVKGTLKSDPRDDEGVVDAHPWLFTCFTTLACANIVIILAVVIRYFVKRRPRSCDMYTLSRGKSFKHVDRPDSQISDEQCFLLSQ